jgi:hypothetical protein
MWLPTFGLNVKTRRQDVSECCLPSASIHRRARKSLDPGQHPGSLSGAVCGGCHREVRVSAYCGKFVYMASDPKSTSRKFNDSLVHLASTVGRVSTRHHLMHIGFDPQSNTNENAKQLASFPDSRFLAATETCRLGRLVLHSQSCRSRRQTPVCSREGQSSLWRLPICGHLSYLGNIPR